MNRTLLSLAAACLSVCMLGCSQGGPSLGAVTGQVTMDGKPLPNVAVTFMPTGEGGTASGKTDANGKYELNHASGKGAPVGKNKVSVTTVQQTETAVDASQMPSDSPEYAKSMGASQNYNVTFTETIPAKYNVKTELEFDVKSGSQVIDLKLESGGAAAGAAAAPATP